jgi:phospholipase C
MLRSHCTPLLPFRATRRVKALRRRRSGRSPRTARLLGLLLPCLVLGVLQQRALAHDAPPAAPLLDHVIVVIMENHSYDQVRSSPYIASLMAAGATFSSSYGVTHPSQPNYLALWAGSTMSVTNDNCPAPGSPYTSENLGHACEAAGVSWRAYSEDLPSAGSPVCTANGSLYARKHEPWTNWSNLSHVNERRYADLAVDIASGSLPRLAFVVPNQCNDMHNCPVSTGDAWLSNNVPAMLQAVGPHGMVVLTWDEDDNSSANHILTVFVGNPVLPNHVSSQTINHYTLLRCLCETLGLTPFGAAAAQSSILDVWSAAIPARSVSWGAVKTLYR